jgi:hypothetical protein
MSAGRKDLAVRVAIGGVIALAVVTAVLVVIFGDTTGRGGSGLGKGFEYDLEEFRRIDESLLRYEETGKIETGFEVARAVAVGPRDRVYVAGDRAVAVFGPDGARLRDIPLDDAPWCLAVDKDGVVFVGMKDRVEVYVAGGMREVSWESPGDGAFFLSVAVAGDNVFVADVVNKIVLRYGLSGKLLGRIGEKDEARGVPGLTVYQPCLDLAVGPPESHDGLLRVTNPGRHRVELYTPEGDLVAWWGEYSARVDGFCGCCNPVNIAVFPDGRTVTAEKFLPRVKVYDEEGKLAAVVAGPEHFEGAPKRIDVAVDSRGRILVLDPVSKAVRIFTRKREDLSAAAQPGEGGPRPAGTEPLRGVPRGAGDE